MGNPKKGVNEMAKKKSSRKPSVKVKDLRSKKNPKGGAADIYLKLGSNKGESVDMKNYKAFGAGLKSGLKIDSVTSLTDSSLKIK